MLYSYYIFAIFKPKTLLIQTVPILKLMFLNFILFIILLSIILSPSFQSVDLFSKLYSAIKYIYSLYLWDTHKFAKTTISLSKSFIKMQNKGIFNILIISISYFPKLELKANISSAQGISLEKALAPHSITLAWRIPWTEEPDRLQSIGSRRVRHN